MRQTPSLGFSSPPYIPALIQLSLSLGAKTFPDHAVQLRATPDHRIQQRADGGVEEVGAKGQYVDGEEAEYGFRPCLLGGDISVWYWLMDVRGCAWGGRAVFRLDVRRVVCVHSLGWEVHETATGSYASERPKYDLSPQ